MSSVPPELFTHRLVLKVSPVMKATILVALVGVSVIVSACGQNPLRPAPVVASAVSASVAAEPGSGFSTVVAEGPCGLLPCPPADPVPSVGPCGSIVCTPPVETTHPPVPNTHQHPSPDAPPPTSDRP